MQIEASPTDDLRDVVALVVRVYKALSEVQLFSERTNVYFDNTICASYVNNKKCTSVDV